MPTCNHAECSCNTRRRGSNPWGYGAPVNRRNVENTIIRIMRLSPKIQVSSVKMPDGPSRRGAQITLRMGDIEVPAVVYNGFLSIRTKYPANNDAFSSREIIHLPKWGSVYGLSLAIIKSHRAYIPYKNQTELLAKFQTILPTIHKIRIQIQSDGKAYIETGMLLTLDQAKDFGELKRRLTNNEPTLLQEIIVLKQELSELRRNLLPIAKSFDGGYNRWKHTTEEGRKSVHYADAGKYIVDYMHKHLGGQRNNQ